MPNAQHNRGASTSRSPAHAAKVLLRTALALVWIYEGLVPKVLFPMARELELVASTGLSWPTPRAALFAVGVVEILCGLWLLTGRGERWAAGLSTLMLIVLTPVIATLNPAILHHPYGGFSKNLGLIACGAAIWMLSGGGRSLRLEGTGRTRRRRRRGRFGLPGRLAHPP